jgi:hypothetical protein
MSLSVACAPDRTSTQFSYRDRSTGVLEVHFLPGARMRTVQFIVFGDGLVAGKLLSVGTEPKVLGVFEGRLEAARVRQWVELAVESGLVDFDPQRFDDEIRRGGGQRPFSVDGSAVLFRIQLDYLDRATGHREAPFVHSFLLDNPDSYFRAYPGTTELETLQEILTALEAIYWKSGQR